MKRFKFFIYFALVAFICCPAVSSSQVLTDFYSYTLTTDGSGYKVSLNNDFRNQLNLASGGSYTSGDYKWVTGDALPNPAPNGMYDGKPVSDMSSLFCGCSKSKSINVSNFNTANVTNMSYMFCSCPALTHLDLSGFNVTKVTDISYMFLDCSAPATFDFSQNSTLQALMQ